jgi:hypothetical protein
MLNLRFLIMKMEHILFDIKFLKNVNVKLKYSSLKMENNKQLEGVSSLHLLLQKEILKHPTNLMVQL